ADVVLVVDADADNDLAGVVIQLDRLDLADLDAGAADWGAGHDAGRVIEGEGVLVGDAEQGRPTAEQDDEHGQEDQCTEDEEAQSEANSLLSHGRGPSADE